MMAFHQVLSSLFYMYRSNIPAVPSYDVHITQLMQ